MPPNSVIYRQGEPADGVYVVLDGTVRLERRGGPRRTIADTHEAGLYRTFGDSVLLGETDRLHTATADSYSTLVKMPLGRLQEILRSYPDLAGDWTYDIMTRPAQVARYRRSAGAIRDIFHAFTAA